MSSSSKKPNSKTAPKVTDKKTKKTAAKKKDY